MPAALTVPRRPIRWYKPSGGLPVIDYSHPLLAVHPRPLASLVVPDYGQQIDIATPSRGFRTKTSTIGQNITRFGQGPNSDNTSEQISFPYAASVDNYTQLTAVVRFRPHGGTTTFSPYISRWDENSNKRSWGLFKVSSAVNAYISTDGVGANNISSATNLTTDKDYTLGMTFGPGDASNNNYIKVYIDGILKATSASIGSATIFNPSIPWYLFFSPRFGGSNNQWQSGVVTFAMIHGSCWTPAQMLALHYDPFQFLIFPQDRLLSTIIGVSQPASASLTGVGSLAASAVHAPQGAAVFGGAGSLTVDSAAITRRTSNSTVTIIT